VSVAGVISQDLLRQRSWFAGRGVAAFRAATGLAVVVPLLLALLSRDLSVATTVGLAFAVAASSFCPLLLLGIWWRRLSDVGALAGLVVGGGLTTAAVLLTVVGGGAPFEAGWPAALLARPAAWSVPLTVLTMVVVSLRTPHRVPAGVNRTMVRLHTPEDVVLDRGGWRPRTTG
jgi:cation/acetate symporter